MKQKREGRTPLRNSEWRWPVESVENRRIKFITLLHHDFFLLCWRMSLCLVPHKTCLDTLTSAPSRYICIQVPQLFSNNFPIIMTFWPTSFSFVYNIISPIIVRTRISSYNFFIDEPFLDFLHVLIITSRCCLNY